MYVKNVCCKYFSGKKQFLMKAFSFYMKWNIFWFDTQHVSSGVAKKIYHLQLKQWVAAVNYIKDYYTKRMFLKAR